MMTCQILKGNSLLFVKNRVKEPLYIHIPTNLLMTRNPPPHPTNTRYTSSLSPSPIHMYIY